MAYKHDYDTILTRLTIMLSRLNDGEALSVKALAEEFNVSERTIQRDFNERLINFPIYQDRKKWKMQDGYRIEKTRSVEDAVVLDIMEKLAEGAGRNFSIKAEKLLSKLKNDTCNPFYAKLDMEDIGDKLKEVEQLESAIKSKHLISCTYRFETFTQTINLKPLKIVNFEGFWYLIAMDAHNDKLKKYYLKSISQIVLKEQVFKSEKRLDDLLENSISIWFEKDVEPYKVELEISPVIAKYFLRKPISKTQRIEEKRETDGMVISVDITHDMEIVPLVKYWMPYIRVLRPVRIQKKLEEDLKNYLNKE